MNQISDQLDITTFLVASIHDMKNSVSVINAVLEDVVRNVDPQVFPEYQKVGQVLYEGQRMSDNLIQLVALYKIQQHFYPFDPQECDLAEFAEEALARVLPLAESRNLSVSCDCEPGLSWVFDRELIFGTVVQSLHNGLRYTHSQVHLNIGRRDGLLEFRIEDDGPGYPEAMLAEDGGVPHQGIHYATGSTGLGLYFSAVAARLHHNQGVTGRTRLENGASLGGGAFILTLP